MGRTKGTSRRLVSDARRADFLFRLGWPRREIGELFQAERKIMRELNSERRAAQKRGEKTEPPITGAWRALKAPLRTVGQYIAKGRRLRESAPKTYQRLLARDVAEVRALHRSAVDVVTGERPFVRERKRPGRPKKPLR